MTLFSDQEKEIIKDKFANQAQNTLITFRHRYGPTQLRKQWNKLMIDLGQSTDCLSWWSSAGTIGLLECHSENGHSIYGQWALADENELLGVFEMSNEDIVNIKDGFDAGNVTSAAMRAIRIGETGDRD